MTPDLFIFGPQTPGVFRISFLLRPLFSGVRLQRAHLTCAGLWGVKEAALSITSQNPPQTPDLTFVLFSPSSSALCSVFISSSSSY